MGNLVLEQSGGYREFLVTEPALVGRAPTLEVVHIEFVVPYAGGARKLLLADSAGVHLLWAIAVHVAEVTFQVVLRFERLRALRARVWPALYVRRTGMTVERFLQFEFGVTFPTLERKHIRARVRKLLMDLQCLISLEQFPAVRAQNLWRLVGRPM